MIQRILPMALFLISTSLSAQELHIPSLQDQIAEAKCDVDLEDLRTGPEAAGFEVNATLCGVQYNINRRAEPKMARSPGNPPPKTALAALIGNISENVTASININVSFEYDASGNITKENWSIQINGSSSAQMGMDDQTGKQHK